MFLALRSITKLKIPLCLGAVSLPTDLPPEIPWLIDGPSGGLLGSADFGFRSVYWERAISPQILCLLVSRILDSWVLKNRSPLGCLSAPTWLSFDSTDLIPLLIPLPHTREFLSMMAYLGHIVAESTRDA
jgi:hypothetical protein